MADYARLGSASLISGRDRARLELRVNTVEMIGFSGPRSR
jgi:hypothetical protein